MNIRTFLAAVLIAALPVCASAVTITDFGTLANNASYNAGNVNLSSDDQFSWEGLVNGSASFTANTYVDPLMLTGAGSANLLIGLSGATSVTGSWDGVTIVFQKIGTTWLADFGTTFTQAGLAGAQLLQISWVGATNDQFSLAIYASDLARVPLPAGIWLMLTGLAGLGLTQVRKRAA